MNKPEILQMFSPIVREPWIAWHNKNILVINERWRLNPQHFSMCEKLKLTNCLT
jgi:Fe-S cluster biosynthesis and repair protein YggX